MATKYPPHPLLNFLPLSNGESEREIKQTSFTKFHIVSFTSVQMFHKLTNKLDFCPLTLSGVHNLLSLGCITIHCALTQRELHNFIKVTKVTKI